MYSFCATKSEDVGNYYLKNKKKWYLRLSFICKHTRKRVTSLLIDPSFQIRYLNAFHFESIIKYFGLSLSWQYLQSCKMAMPVRNLKNNKVFCSKSKIARKEKTAPKNFFFSDYFRKRILHFRLNNLFMNSFLKISFSECTLILICFASSGICLFIDKSKKIILRIYDAVYSYPYILDPYITKWLFLVWNTFLHYISIVSIAFLYQNYTDFFSRLLRRLYIFG